MKEDKVERLLKKYQEGQSTLKEEAFLFDNTESLEPSFEAWSTFVKNNKTETPKDFNERLWQSFQNRKKKKRKLFVGGFSVAASVILLIALFFTNPKEEELNYAEKEALLSLAKEIVANSTPAEIEQNIIYENEIIIIYTTKE